MCLRVLACACVCLRVLACACVCLRVLACACMCLHVLACASPLKLKNNTSLSKPLLMPCSSCAAKRAARKANPSSKNPNQLPGEGDALHAAFQARHVVTPSSPVPKEEPPSSSPPVEEVVKKEESTPRQSTPRQPPPKPTWKQAERRVSRR